MTGETVGRSIPSNWEEVTTAFERHLVEQSMAESSVTMYSLAVRKFGAFYRQELGRTGPYVTRLKSSDLEAFIKHAESARYLSRASVNQTVSALRSFSRFLLREKWQSRNISQGLRTKFTARQKVHRRLSVKEGMALIDSVALCCREVERDRAILQIMLQCGLRVKEIVRLSYADIGTRGKQQGITVRGERDIQQRFLPLNRAARKALNDYLSLRGTLRQEDPVFLSNRGKPLSAQSVQYLAKKYLCVIGRPELSADDLRHEFALRLHERTGDLALVQESLGHLHKATTARYVRTGQ